MVLGLFSSLIYTETDRWQRIIWRKNSNALEMITPALQKIICPAFFVIHQYLITEEQFAENSGIIHDSTIFKQYP